MNNIKFQTYWKKELTADVSVIDNKINIISYSSDPVKQIFQCKNLDCFQFMEILESRCIPRNRANISEILKIYGLSTYDVIEILKKTHGLSQNDYFWIKFEGENISYDDVKIRED